MKRKEDNQLMSSLLNESNFSKGFLISDQTIAGVTQLEEAAMGSNSATFIAYASDYFTGETLYYQERSSLNEALEALHKFTSMLPDSSWNFEAVGCSSNKKSTGLSSVDSSCKNCSCSSTNCG
jgi:hypothetical protein